MLNPSVGDIVLTSSPLNFFRIVVFPALSRPLKTWLSTTLLLSISGQHKTQQNPRKLITIIMQLSYVDSQTVSSIKDTALAIASHAPYVSFSSVSLITPS